MKNLYKRLIIGSLILFSIMGLNAQNTVSFFLTTEGICAPSVTYFNNTSTILSFNGGPYYEWWLDGALVDNTQFPSPQVLPEGNHHIELYVKDDLGNLGYYSEMINITGTIDTFYVKSGLIACPGEELTFSVEGDPYMIEWDFGEGSLLPGSSIYQNYAKHSYLSEGVYTVTLMADNGCGFVNLSQDIEIKSSATPQFTPYIVGNSTVCPNEEIIFDVDGDFSSYLWDFGDGKSSTLKSPVHTYPDQGTGSYTVDLTVTNYCGKSDTKSLIVSIDFNPEADASFNFTMDSPFSDPCPGTQVFFHANSSGTHRWSFGDGGVSTLRDPVYNFSSPGIYTIEHTITSGCGVTNVSSQEINVILNPEEVAWNLSFSFDLDFDYEEMMFIDTLTVCPGETVSFKNQTYYPYTVFFNWNFGDGGTQITRDAKHRFDNQGLYEVILTATTGCGGISSVSKYIVVDSEKKPDALLGVVPMLICPDETVYFFDDNFDPKNKLKYHIDFGDGNVLNDITNITDLELFTIASHQYSGAGPFNFSFKAENTCGNITERTETISVDNDDSRKPFYYVMNSTEDESQRPPEDWSAKNDGTDHQLDIFVQWDSWQPAYGDTFYIYFWYEGFVTEGEQAVPDGIIKFYSADIVSGETVTAWIPMNLMGANEVGMAAGYFCDGLNFDSEPEAWGTLMDGQLNMVNSIPLIPGGYTDITEFSPTGIQIDPSWDGICNSELAEGTWYREVSPGIFAVIDLYEASPGYYYYFMEYRDKIENWTESNYISGGPYIYPNYPDVSTVEFQDEGCGSYIPYNFIRPSENQIQFILTEDACAERTTFLNGVFEKYLNNQNQLSVCPGDIVDFQIAGGASYVWDFGDGSPTSTLQFPDHSYSNPGTYNAFVTATNSCGRVDVINTTVTISSENIPQASFYVENFNISRMDTVWFNPFSYDTYGGITDNNNYFWEFGDGKTSAMRDPFHVYTEAGKYKVKLSVSNNCGTSDWEQEIFVKEKFLLCEAKFEFDIDGLSVGFRDNSVGDPTNWEWDFGDGNFSSLQNPDYNYAADGVYYVKLTTYNNLNQCVSSSVRKLTIGNVLCDAGFTFVVNNTSKLVKFLNTSLNSGSYFWDFGDNNLSDLQNPEHTYRNPGLYTVCLTVMDDASGCQSVYCADVFVGTSDIRVKADFSYFPLEDGLSVSFNDLSAGNITKWYWTTGDGKMKTKPSFTYTYPKSGIYKVCLMVIDENTGLSDEICKLISVGDVACKLKADFDFFVKASANELILEDKSSEGTDKWYWTFGDGYSSKDQNPRHIYEKPGFYLVTLSIFDATNNCMDHSTKFIQIGDMECRADFKIQINPDTKQVILNNTSTGAIRNYFWDFGNGKYSTLKSPTFSYPKAGKYVIGLTVIDSSQVCVDYTSKEVQIGEIDCSAAFDYYVDSLTSTAYFQNRVVGDYSQMLWIFGDGTYTTKANPTHRFKAPGYYKVSLNTFNADNNCMDYYETVVLIGSEGLDCQANFIFQPDDLPNSIRFKDKSFGDIQDFVWSFGDGNHSKEISPVHNYPQEGYYFTCLTVWNNFGIPNTNCRWVPVNLSANKDCRAHFMFTVDSINLKAAFTDNSYGEIDTWRWDFGDGTTSNLKNPTHSYAEKGYYRVKLISGNSTSGCKSNEVKLLNVGEENKLKVSFDYEADSTNLKASGYPIDFVGTTSGDASSYEWDFGDEQLKRFTVMDSTTSIITHYYDLPGVYTACLRASDPISDQYDVYCEKVKTAFAVSTDVFESNKGTMTVYPNPANEYTSISYNLPATTLIEIAIFDAMGRRIETLVRTEKEKGNHKISWNTSSLNQGLYLVKLMTSDQIITQGVVINK
ncbi:MAG: PKD domain-containing protein [Bacteroidales bacterium]|nr:PKD domain-containing protein [Bacteroidales bacterium]MCF8391752.1 PKD domain-containing protein [Bacteroidales bacterium]